MSALTVFLYVLVVLVSLLLIGLILIQPAKSGGMGAAFGGIGESVFGAKAGSHLTKATVYMTSIFFVIALVLAALIGHGVRLESSGETAVDSHLEAVGKSAPVKAPAKTPAKAPVPTVKK